MVKITINGAAVEVQEGAGELTLMYYPAWSEDKIPLGTVKL